MAIYLPELVDKIVTTIAGLKANWEDYIDHAGNTADAHGIDVIAEDLADHAAETAEDDVHGLAGKIIEESGSNKDGSYVRFSNGLQVCWGSKTIPGEGWSGSGDKRYLTGQGLYFPITFASAPIFLGTTRDAQIGARSAKLTNFNAGTSNVSNIAFSGWGTASGSFYLHWVAIGWWK